MAVNALSFIDVVSMLDTDKVNNPQHVRTASGATSTTPPRAHPLSTLHSTCRDGRSSPVPQAGQVLDRRPLSFLVVIGPDGPQD